MKNLLLLIFGLVMFCGCDSAFRRRVPDQAEYIKKIIPEITAKNIKRIDYLYTGNVGGYITIARIELFDIKELTPIQNIKVAKTYCSDDESRDIDADCIKSIFLSGIGKKNAVLPEWFDMAFDKPIQKHTISRNGQVRHFFTSSNLPVFFLLAGGN